MSSRRQRRVPQDIGAFSRITAFLGILAIAVHPIVFGAAAFGTALMAHRQRESGATGALKVAAASTAFGFLVEWLT